MYNSGNSSKNVTGASVVDGTLYTVDIADDAVTADKLANTVNADIATGVSGSTTAGDALPKTGGAMTGAITTNSTFDGVDVATRDAVLTSTTNTANAALPKAGGTMTGTIANFRSTGIDDNATSTAITIDASENVGIGTATPAHRLSIVGGASTVLQMSHGSSAVYNWAMVAQYLTTQAFQIVPSTVVGGSVFTTPIATFKGDTGRVGIGTTAPAVPLDVTGDIRTSTGILFGTDTAAANALDDYEEGTWTPVITSGVGTITAVGSVNGTYVKIGRSVTVSFEHIITTNGTGASYIKISGLPFASSSTGYGSAGSREQAINGIITSLSISPSSSEIRQYKYDNSYPGANGAKWNSSITYQV